MEPVDDDVDDDDDVFLHGTFVFVIGDSNELDPLGF